MSDTKSGIICTNIRKSAFKPFHMRIYLFLVTIVRRFVKYGSLHTVRQILLLHIMLGVVVGIPVACPMPQLFRSLVMLVLQMDGHRHGPFIPHRFHGLLYRHTGSVALWSRGHIGNCL